MYSRARLRPPMMAVAWSKTASLRWFLRFADRGEMNYAYEMAMDFFGRQKLRARCERLLDRAYQANACTVELCEAYREVTGEYVAQACWYSLVIEADYRTGLLELRGHNGSANQPPTRFTRNYQVVARNHDEIVDYEGRGLATILVSEAFQATRAAGKRIVAVCALVASYLDKHRDFEQFLRDAVHTG